MIWKRYGMTEWQYSILCKVAGCWVCGREHKKDGSNLRLYIDHDHKTGRVRGRLCYTCNRRLIGRRRDGELYRQAAYYLDSDFDARKITKAKKGAALSTTLSPAIPTVAPCVSSAPSLTSRLSESTSPSPNGPTQYLGPIGPGFSQANPKWWEGP